MVSHTAATASNNNSFFLCWFFRTFIVSQSAALYIILFVFFSRDCLTIKTKPRIIHLTLDKIILKKKKTQKNSIFADYFDKLHSKVINVPLINLIVVITIPSPCVSLSADAFHWSMKWSFRCLPINRRPIKRRLLSWQLPGEQTTDVRATEMIAWSEDTWWEAAPVLHSRPVWDFHLIKSRRGCGGLNPQTDDHRETCPVVAHKQGLFSLFLKFSVRHFLPGVHLLPTCSGSIKHYTLKTGGETINRPKSNVSFVTLMLNINSTSTQMLLLMHLADIFCHTSFPLLRFALLVSTGFGRRTYKASQMTGETS